METNTDKHPARNLAVLTFSQFINTIAAEWQLQGYDFDADDLRSSATPLRWHEENLLPFARGGGEFPLSVCKSITVHGWRSLEWFAREYPNCLGRYVDVRSGRVIARKDLTQNTATPVTRQANNENN